MQVSAYWVPGWVINANADTHVFCLLQQVSQIIVGSVSNDNGAHGNSLANMGAVCALASDGKV
jgi:hypothetical protein